VYPLLARLEQDGLLATTNDVDDGRGRKHLNVTSQGISALRTWVLAGADPDLISSLTDPVRSRTFFMDILGSARQLAFLDKLIRELDCYLASTRTHLDEVSAVGDLYDYLGSLGAVRVTEARLGWLREVRRRLSAGK
jgi:DNA-binding PadR family transcriptional regulator